MCYTQKFSKQLHKILMRFLINTIFQHASEGVERMILANKCDMNDKRMVSKEKGDNVSTVYLGTHHLSTLLVYLVCFNVKFQAFCQKTVYKMIENGLFRKITQ